MVPNDDRFLNPWQYSIPNAHEGKHSYVCVSGNSGTGKSTLVRLIASAIKGQNLSTIAIDEGSLHHPFLPYLFFQPQDYAFEMQLNFMLQRSLLVKHWIQKGYNLVMERSHLEDLVFIRHLKNEKYIGTKEYEAYLESWKCINNRTPTPDLMIFLDVSPEISIKRLQDDEDQGRRPREFPDEKLKQRWINSWYTLYLDRMDQIKREMPSSMRFITLGENYDPDQVQRLVMGYLGIAG